MGRLLTYLGSMLMVLAMLVGVVWSLWAMVGIWLLITPLSLAVLVLSGLVARGLVEEIRARKLYRLEAARSAELMERRRLAELEAAVGLPLATDGSCHSCGAPLLQGAKFCSQCRAQTLTYLRARICDVCATRNLDDATYCAECGEPLAPQAALHRPAPSEVISPA